MNILFVCTGNTCRSPMAEAILLDKKIKNIHVRSAGIFANTGEPLSSHAQSVLKKQKIKYHHQARQLDEADLTWATLILTMTASHKQQICIHFPEIHEKVFTLKEFNNQADLDISDPFGANEQVYQNTFEELKEQIELMIESPRFTGDP